ncbi:hypothetical protein O1Q96_23390 [Streptomyces sp. Qhu-G9]|uniref:hypothetical protein n=1 Tax=Streptomyces sp. Qhu-G9 TaxID=3452799 RepID=UPI0022AC1525|nr:hypothetical protein [Streptomyces aurantiacus]WAU82434.1 hypothetical protein O1Q96_23390 [Streptomyces aurantiacus]
MDQHPATWRPTSPSPLTVRSQVTFVIPFLRACSEHYRTLRQVTRADLIDWLARCASPHNEAVALRGMFKTLKAQRLLFTNPARGLSLGTRPSSVPKPMSPAAIETIVAAADTDPALKLLIALVGIHALYPHHARALRLAALDFTGSRLVTDDVDHPLDDFTRRAASDYLHLRRTRWPHSRNPHLFISAQTAHTHASITNGWIQLVLRDLPATAQQLREDRLEEAAATGADPLHLCALFNISAETRLRYTRPFHPGPDQDLEAHQ